MRLRHDGRTRALAFGLALAFAFVGLGGPVAGGFAPVDADAATKKKKNGVRKAHLIVLINTKKTPYLILNLMA